VVIRNNLTVSFFEKSLIEKRGSFKKKLYIVVFGGYEMITRLGGLHPARKVEIEPVEELVELPNDNNIFTLEGVSLKLFLRTFLDKVDSLFSDQVVEEYTPFGDTWKGDEYRGHTPLKYRGLNEPMQWDWKSIDEFPFMLFFKSLATDLIEDGYYVHMCFNENPQFAFLDSVKPEQEGKVGGLYTCFQNHDLRSPMDRHKKIYVVSNPVNIHNFE
jgi:hypothetical protein